MNATTPQIVRSLLRHIPRSLPKRSFVCVDCQSRGFASSDRSKSNQRIVGHARATGQQQWRSWSSSRINCLSSAKDKPSEAILMPPPPGHENNTPVDSDSAQTTRQNGHVEAVSVSAPAPASASEPPKAPEGNISDTIPDIPPTRPFPVEEVPPPPQETQGASASSTSTPAAETSDHQPRHTPRPESKASADSLRMQGNSIASWKKFLPSQSEQQRWQVSKRTQNIMDDFLAKAAIFSQQLNTYTGTDYSGIEALRREIIEQERHVRACHAAVSKAKESYQQSYAAQASSQKEVVGLLERKHSWSAADLERYMSLIRSEHLNEQTVQRAKDELAAAERELEAARSLLEKKERKQYHEEQIWSDTIRRNSTWVTFGLMGLNIFLLLANLAIIEPWRRKRLVKEVRSALEESAEATHATIAAATAVPTAVMSKIEDEVDRVIEPADEKLEELEKGVVEPVPEGVLETVSETVSENVSEPVPESAHEPEVEPAVGEKALAAGLVLPDEVVEGDGKVVEAVVETLPAPSRNPTLQKWEEVWEHYKGLVKDLFSERQVTLRKVDATALALEGAVAGIALMGFLMVMFNPR